MLVYRKGNKIFDVLIDIQLSQSMISALVHTIFINQCLEKENAVALEAVYLDVSIDAPEGRVDKEPGKGKGEQCGTEGHEEATLPDGQHICVRTRKVQIFRNF